MSAPVAEPDKDDLGGGGGARDGGEGEEGEEGEGEGAREGALAKLVAYIVACGGDAAAMQGWYVESEERKSLGPAGSRTSDLYYFSAEGQRFRSRKEAARRVERPICPLGGDSAPCARPVAPIGPGRSKGEDFLPCFLPVGGALLRSG